MVIKMSSIGEEKIEQILLKNHIDFIREKTFKDLKNGTYRFDFYLPQYDSVIEFQGQQHYKFISKFFKNRSEFLAAQERDRRKISYCLANQITIYCIPYWELNNIKDVSSLLNSKFKANSRWFNDETWKNYGGRK